MKSHCLPVCLAAVLLFASLKAEAAVVVFIGSDFGANSASPRPNATAAAANYDAAAASLGTTTTINFESTALGSANSLTIAPGVTTSATAASIVKLPIGSPEELFGYNTTLGGTQFLSLNGGNVTFNFANPIQSIGFYLSGVQLEGETITFNDGSPQSISIPFSAVGGITFVGFTDVGASISSITYTGQNDIYGIDDMRITTADSTDPTVPEAGSFTVWALLGIAGIALMIWRSAWWKRCVGA